MIRTVVFRPQAQAELHEAVAWYDLHRHGLGAELIREVEGAVLQAVNAPTRWPIAISDIRRISTRRFPYILFFRVRRDTLVVLAVFHARRDPQTWKSLR